MDEETFNISIRKFLKVVGVSSQREIEQAVGKAIADGRLAGDETLAATMTLRIGALPLEVIFDGEIRLQQGADGAGYTSRRPASLRPAFPHGSLHARGARRRRCRRARRLRRARLSRIRAERRQGPRAARRRDGQKPVQRRILYAMTRMGLAFTRRAGAKPVKSARVVGDVLGRFHPHGDQAAYDALVRMAQDFSQRYPLIDGQGNFGSRDGDGAAAMRYTEARLAPIARLLLDEIDEGTVDFIPNYDGSTEEPQLLPARLPFVLLNGASGIAVGLATEIPSHNLREVADAAVALIKQRQARRRRAARAACPGPDYPGGGQIISSAGGHPRRLRDRPRLAQGARALEDRGPRARPVAARRHRAAAGRRARRRCWRRSRS